MFTKSLLVSHDGVDELGCGNWTTPCLTLRYAVLISSSGDKILIDHAQNKPYKECDILTQSRSVIQLNKSLSFIGVNGTAIIECKKGLILFNIQSSTFNPTKIVMSNMTLSTSDTLIHCDKGSLFHLLLHNCVFKSFYAAVSAKSTTFCSIYIFNSTFYGSTYSSSVVTSCHNLTTQLVGNMFQTSPVTLRTLSDSKTVPWQFTQVFVSQCVFNGQQKQLCTALLSVSSSSAIVNITVELSVFTDHKGNCKSSRVSTLDIYGGYFGKRRLTVINLNKLSFENNYCTGAMVRFIPIYIKGTLFKVGIRNSVFKNTTSPLYAMFHGKRSRIKGPSLVLSNNTFLKAYKGFANSWPIVKLGNGKYSITQCTFIDNIGGNRHYDAIIRVKSILHNVVVIFNDCYFENSRATSSSTQIFAEKKHKLFFYNNTMNMIHLNKESDIVTFTSNNPSGGNRNLRLRGNLKILCPFGYLIASNKYCQEAKNKKYIECAYFSVSCKLCPKNTYSITRSVLQNNITNQVQCYDCVNGGQCFEGILTAKPNFWGYKTDHKVHFLQCPRDYCCDGNDCDSYNSCHGNRTGTVCGECPQSMSESILSTDCLPNDKCGSNLVWPLALCYCTTYLFFFLYHEEIIKLVKKLVCFSRQKRENQSSSDHGRSHKTSGLLKIFFYYYQVVHLFRNSVGSHKHKTIVNNVENMLSKVFNFIILSISSFKCPFPDLYPVKKQVLLHSVGYVLLVFLGVLYIITKSIVWLKHTRRFRDATAVNQTSTGHTSCFTSRITSAFTYISLLMYASSAQLCLSLLHCVPIDDHQVLFLDGNTKFYQTFQYFLLAYMISSILPFCLVPVLGSYLLKFDRIGVKQFCAACIFPLPFCCFWLNLFIKEFCCGRQATYNTLVESDNVVRSDQSNNEESPGGEEMTAVVTDNETTSRISERAILKVLLGPFRPHQAFKCFPSSRIPWEGFLIFRRLVLIIVLTFVYDIQLKLFLALTVCVAILIIHMLVKPFQRKLDNVLEAFSLGTHVVQCGSTLIKALHYSEDYSSFPKSLSHVLNVFENVIVVGPMSIIMVVVILSFAIKIVCGLKLCISVLTRIAERLTL